MLSILTLLCFLATSINGPNPVFAQDFPLPAPGVMVYLSPQFNPPILKGIKVHPDHPFRFDFILDKENSNLSEEAVKSESTRLIKYFLASLTIPEKDLWVNLSPYEKNRIVPESFGQTEMGRDLLAQDYMLKQITASLIYPEGELGKKFWKRVYEQAAKKFGTTDIPVNTFNKVWILPEKAVVYENAKAGTAYIVESKLKVMLEQDYLAYQKQLPLTPSLTKEGENSVIPPLFYKEGARGSSKNINSLASQVIRDIILPELTKEVNEGRNFAPLRQVYNSLILATWYKKKIRDSILEQVYADKNKIAGININDRKEKEKIYQLYLKAFKKGAYNYIKEEIDPITDKSIPRKYFSGGFRATDLAQVVLRTVENVNEVHDSVQNLIDVNTDLAMAPNTLFGSSGRNAIESLGDVMTLLNGKKGAGELNQFLGNGVDAYKAYGPGAIYHLIRDVRQRTGFVRPISALRFDKNANGLFDLPQESGGFQFKKGQLTEGEYFILRAWIRRTHKQGRLSEYNGIKGLIKLIDEINEGTDIDLIKLKGINIGHLTWLLNSEKNIQALIGVTVKGWDMPKIDMPMEQFMALQAWTKGQGADGIKAYGSMEGLILLVNAINEGRDINLIKLKGINLGHLTGLLNSEKNIEALVGATVEGWDMPFINLPMEKFKSLQRWAKGQGADGLKKYGSMEGLILLVNAINEGQDPDLSKLEGIHLGQLTGLLHAEKNIEALIGAKVEGWDMPLITMPMEEFKALQAWTKGQGAEGLKAYGSMEGLILLVNAINEGTDINLRKLKGINIGHLTGLLHSQKNIEALIGVTVEGWDMPKIEMTMEQFKALQAWAKGQGAEGIKAYGSMEGLILLINAINEGQDLDLEKLQGINIRHLTRLLHSKKNIEALIGATLEAWDMPVINMTMEQFKALQAWAKGQGAEGLKKYGSMEGLILLVNTINEGTDINLSKLEGIHLGQLTGLLHAEKNIEALVGVKVEGWNMPRIDMSMEQFKALQAWAKGQGAEGLKKYGSMEGLILLVNAINKGTDIDLKKLKGINIGHLTGMLYSENNIRALIGVTVEGWDMPYVNATWGDFLEKHGIKDLAMTKGLRNTGGIDFNSNSINLQTQHNNGEIKFLLDPAMVQQLQKAPGFEPMIISVEPLKSLQEFLINVSSK